MFRALGVLTALILCVTAQLTPARSVALGLASASANAQQPPSAAPSPAHAAATTASDPCGGPGAGSGVGHPTIASTKRWFKCEGIPYVVRNTDVPTAPNVAPNIVPNSADCGLYCPPCDWTPHYYAAICYPPGAHWQFWCAGYTRNNVPYDPYHCSRPRYYNTAMADRLANQPGVYEHACVEGAFGSAGISGFRGMVLKIWRSATKFSWLGFTASTTGGCLFGVVKKLIWK